MLILKNGLSVPLSIKSGGNVEKLIGILRLDRSSWGLGHGVYGDLGQVQVKEGSFNLTEAIFEAVSKVAAELEKEGIGVTELCFPVLLSSKDLHP